MTYPSRQKEARKAESKARWEQQKKQLQQVNERLAAIGIDHSELLRLIVEGKVEVKIVKESEKCTSLILITHQKCGL